MTTQQVHDQGRLSRIRKLLAQAEDAACTPEEAEAFTAKAAALMARHGIDEALVAQTDPARDPLGDRVVELLAPYAREKGTLGAVVAEALRCQAVLRRSRGATILGEPTTDHSLHLFGHAGDLARAEMMFTSLLVQSARDVGRTRAPRGEHVAAFRRTWWLGFASAVGSRLRAAEESAARAAEPRFAAQGTTASLVLADRSALAERAMWQAYPDLQPAAPRRLSGSGVAQGWAAGQRADLGEGARLDGAGPRGLGRR